MKLSLKWLTPVLLRLLTLSHVSFADGFSNAAFNNPGSVHLVTGFYVGLAANSQPRADLSLDSATFLPLASDQFALPVMPLHLLGKKSWNVYNQDNIAKVKRDEAAARAREEAEDERMQEIDSERRLQLLRGEAVSALPAPIASATIDKPHHHAPSTSTRERKKRKRANEDDTDFELRLARDQQQPPPTTTLSTSLVPTQKINKNAPITDHTGHISLFAPPSTTSTTTPTDPDTRHKNKDPAEDRANLRFSHAAGYDTTPTTAPWYSSVSAPPNAPDDSTSSSSQRAAHTASQDPLTLMRRGASAARRVDLERKTWLAEREREMVLLAELEAERSRERKRRKRWRGDDELEGFRLDVVSDEQAGDGDEGQLRRGEREQERERERERRHRHNRRDGSSSHHHHHHRHRHHREHRGQREHRQSRQ